MASILILILVCETKRNEIYGVGRKNAYYPKHSLRQQYDNVFGSNSSSNFATITILRNGVFSPLFSKYALFVRNKMCPPIK